MKITTNTDAISNETIDYSTEGAILADGSTLIFDTDSGCFNFVIFSTDGKVDIRAGLIETWDYRTGSISISEVNKILFAEKLPIIQKLLTNVEIEIKV